MAAGKGVSYEDLGGGKWRLRWREKIDGKRKSREMRFTGSPIERDRLIVEIRAAIAEGRRFEGEVRAEAVNEAAASLWAGMEACIEARVAGGKYSDRTANTYRSYALRCLDSVHRALDIPEDVIVPVTVLSRDLFVSIQRRDRAAGASQQMSYAPLRFLLDAWRWMADDPGRWTGIPTAPNSPKDYLPRTPKYGRTIAPTIAHVDACIRHLPDQTSRGTVVMALFLRYTGLRSIQVLSIQRDDIDLDAGTLYVRTGKTQQEKADARTVPLADALLNEPGVIEWIELARPGEPVFRKRRHAGRKTQAAEARTKQPVETIKAGWQGATDAGEAPLHVWAPPNRRMTRPEHSFRAAFQAYLEAASVPGNVIDYLVGHEGATVRDTHYGRDLLDAARNAVNQIPPVDWTGPEARESGKVIPIKVIEAVR